MAAAGFFGEGDLVYLPAPDVAFAPGTVVGVDRGGAGVDVRMETTGEVLHASPAELRQRFAREDGATCQDNTSLVHMNDATILENLQARHKRDEIYTYTASVLLAVNPYKDIRGLYGEDMCQHYRGKHIGALAPHPYAIADTAYRALVRERRNQGLLISGESGAGKTETAKIVMQFLAFASGATSGHADSIQARVVRAQPILESLGNAVTMRNSNSSRFGKYNRVFFDGSGALVDAGITTYLLESSRVVTHGERERTYHCFYEMLRGLDDARLEAFGLERGRRYRLLTSPSGEALPGFESRDAVNFARLCDALRTIGLDEAGVDNMLRILAGLIHLGDIEKDPEKRKADKEEDDGEPVQVDEVAVERAAKMLGMDADELCARLTRKKVAVPGRSSYHEVPRNVSQFRHALQSFIKAIYKRLFDRTVKRINDCFRDLRPSGLGDANAETMWNHIGILDIYGFENLQRNSFEQLCINLANERLQQYFVENVLRAEQELYKREGLPWIGLALPDAQPVFNTINQVFKTLDEYSQNLSRGVGNATDKSFCQKVVDESTKDVSRRDVLKQIKMTGGGRRSTAGPMLNEGFIIKHYAGQVQYNTEGWLDKNNDRLLAECETLICESSDPLVKSLGEEDSQNAKGPLFRSISKKYSKDLESLLETLSTCNLHYIRCFKPNGEQKADLFQGAMVLDQIVQCGTIELVKIMHDGYPNRCPFEEITTRFRDLLPERFQRYGMRTFIEALMLAYEVPREEWALGMSRLFLKAGQLRALEGMRAEGAAPPAEKLAEIVRGIIRKKWLRAGHAVRLCNYVPKFVAQIYERRASKSLAQAAALASRLAPRLAAARQRVEGRRLVGAFRAVRFVQAEFAAIRRNRRARLEKALRLAMFLHARTKPWVEGARERAAEVAKRREAERRREEERRKAEEERQRQEREKLEAERKQMEEEQAKREAEQKVREAEQRRLDEERRAKDEELQRDLERQREDLRKKEEEERQALAEERRKLAEERLALEEEKKQRNSILAQASPQHARSGSAVPTAAAIGGGSAFGLPPAAEDGAASRHSGAGDSTLHASTDVGEDEFNLGDSVSNLGTMHSMQSLTEMQVSETVKRLEREMAQKHEEIKQQMALLQEKNLNLEMQLAEEKRTKRETISDAGNDSPQRRRKPSLIPLDDDQQHLQGTPATTPQSSCRNSRKPPRQSSTRSAQRYSLLSIDGSASRPGGGSKAKRHSIAHEALLRQESGGVAGYSIGDAPGSASDLGSQRRWWAEQRTFLLEDLYGDSPASRRGSLPTGNSGRFGGVGGLRRQEPPVAHHGSQQNSHRGSVPAAVEEEGAAEEEGRPPAAGRASAAGGGLPPFAPPGRSEVRNLSSTFENLQDGSLAPAAGSDGANAADGGGGTPASARQQSNGPHSKMRQPTKFEWNKRRSLGGSQV